LDIKAEAQIQVKRKQGILLSFLFALAILTVWIIVSAGIAEAMNTSFVIHYIDVSQGDCALVLCDGQSMLIDGGEASASSKVYAYLRAHGVDHLNYIIASHAHADHVGGLSGALNYTTVDVALCPVLDYDTKSFRSFVKHLRQQNIANLHE